MIIWNQYIHLMIPFIIKWLFMSTDINGSSCYPILEGCIPLIFLLILFHSWNLSDIDFIKCVVFLIFIKISIDVHSRFYIKCKNLMVFNWDYLKFIIIRWHSKANKNFWTILIIGFFVRWRQKDFSH